MKKIEVFPKCTVVKNSGIHGKGVYATKEIPKGKTIFEYKGEIISPAEVDNLPTSDMKNPNHTFLFTRDDGLLINAGKKGNSSHFINHSCKPNCETKEKKGKIFIYTLKKIRKGEELFYDYRIQVDKKRTKKLEKEFLCLCGNNECRGT